MARGRGKVYLIVKTYLIETSLHSPIFNGAFLDYSNKSAMWHAGVSSLIWGMQEAIRMGVKFLVVSDLPILSYLVLILFFCLGTCINSVYSDFSLRVV